MAAVQQRKLVHKQFNSPMGLYSAQNVKETLNRELKAFGGADGIEVDPQILKPANLSNSAVLKALEEEEMEKINSSYKKVAWPPAPEHRFVREYTPQPANQQQQQQYSPPQQQSTQNLPPAPSAPTYQSVPVSHHQSSTGPQYYQNQPESAPVAPHSPYQGDYQQSRYSQPPEYQYNGYSQQPQQVYQPQAYRGESPGIITLRKEAPITQTPSPIFSSQPVAASFRGESDLGGSNMRGDMKWPPAEYKAQAEVENQERRKLALGPVCRPRRINKDYSQFFAKNAINNYYPSYKVPPGTQHMSA